MQNNEINNKRENIIIALDGPAGAGKSTIAKKIADKLNLLYIDTGAMYRAITYVIIKKEIDMKNETEINALLKDVKIDFKKNKENRIDVYFEDKMINQELRTQMVEKNVSLASSYQKVREHMVELQRQISMNYNVILDGRDIGTVVFPDTKYKFYLDASVDERAKRRLLDSKNKETLSFDEIKKDIIRRDEFDSSRKISPLKQAEDAIRIDSTNMSIDEVVNYILDKM